MRRTSESYVECWLVFALLATSAVPAGQTAQRAIPRAPIEEILDAFKTHDVVVLGEGPHGNAEGHRFRLALIRDPRFAATVDDIVVEFGSGRYQALMDRFIGGEDVDLNELRRAWQDTTVVTPAWDGPIYEEFFRAVREVNRRRSQDRRLRVLLGDATIDWSTTRTRADVHRWGIQKGRHTAEVIRTEVLGKHRRALVIYGDSHFQGRRVPDHRLPINILEGPPTRARVFTIATLFRELAQVQDDVSQWPVPSVASISGTAIGARPLASFYPIPPAPGWSHLRMEDEFDAVLFLGNTSPTIVRLTREQCGDRAYMRMRLARMTLNVIQVRQASIDALKRYCAAVATN